MLFTYTECVNKFSDTNAQVKISVGSTRFADRAFSFELSYSMRL